MPIKEGQLGFGYIDRKVPGRSRRRHTKTLARSERQPAVDYWRTQIMLRPFLEGAETFRANMSAEIATAGGQNVESVSADFAQLDSMEKIERVIRNARLRNIPAKDVIDALYSMTKTIARNSIDEIGWTASYFGMLADKVIEVYPRSKKYGNELKKKALNIPMIV